MTQNCVILYAEVAELADALDSKSSVVTLRAGSSPAFGTTDIKALGRSPQGFLFLYQIEKAGVG